MKKLFKVMAAAACALSLTACGGSSKKSDTLVVGAEELTGTFSPLYYTGAYDGYVIDLVYNKLMEYDVDGNLQPSLAEKTDVAKDGKTITFNLRKGVKFSDGSDFTAKDVEFSYKVVSDPSYTGRFISTCQYLEGYKQYNNKKNKEEPDYPGIEVKDDYTVVFHFTEARNDNLQSLMNISVISSNQFKDSYAYKKTKPIQDAVGKPIGTGPYVLDKWEAGTGASLKKNEKYWGDDYKGLANVIIKPVKMETEYQELKSGNIDLLAGQIEPKKIGPASNNEDLTINHYPRGGMGYITYNTVNGATSEKEVRQALSYAFDRQSFVNSYYECKDCKDLDGVEIGYVPTTWNNPISKLGKVITGEEKVDGLTNYSYDIEKAKKLLDDAGWKVGASGFREKDGQKLEIKIMAIKDHDILNNLIPMWKKAWGEELKADVKVATVDFNTLMDKVYYDKNIEEWNVYFMATSFTDDTMSGAVTNFDSKYVGDGLDNTSRLKDEKLDSLMDAALTEMDMDKAKDKWVEAQKQVNEDVSALPVYGNTYFDFYNKKIKNLKTSALYQWTHGLRDATIE